MSANDALLFIDANKYLALYGTKAGKKGLAGLAQQADRIFVTQQVVDEVLRNKIKVMATFLAGRFKKPVLQLQPYGTADHLVGATDEQQRIIGEKITKASTMLDQISTMLDEVTSEETALALEMLEQVSQSKDPVSVALAPIFAKAVPHSNREMQLAKERKERGNPPGKPGDAVGDQLNWEQILTHLADKKKLWIITQDKDFGAKHYDRFFWNPLLLADLRRISPDIEAFLFTDILGGIQDFARKTGVSADQLPPQDVIEEIRHEENSLPPLDWLKTANTDVSGMAAMNAHPIFQSQAPVFGWYSVGTVPSANAAMLNISSSSGTPSKFVPEPE